MLGGAPYNTPALYSIMSHVDFHGNVFYPEGGIAGVVDALASLARAQGAEIRTGTPVTSIFRDRFGDPGGTALGLAYTLFQTGPLRPSKRDGPDGCYYVGAYTNPGIGMPMCLLSGEHVARAVVADDPGAA